MPTKNETLRNSLADSFGDLWDQGGAANGSRLHIKDSGGTVLVTFTLNADAFASASTGQISANGLPKTEAASATGTADHAELISADGSTYQLTGLTVDTSNAHVIINNRSITSGEDVTLTQFDWTESDTVQAA